MPAYHRPTVDSERDQAGFDRQNIRLARGDAVPPDRICVGTRIAETSWSKTVSRGVRIVTRSLGFVVMS